ncbi:hypothetical protein Hypma_002394 [Hypsizygus marmoreus]|uniref:Uncharacterized protein n=1 Tax=Hypsizygus marmoreus TaxID=39966 RepID=A0A369JDK4_HYPMA|nr:hypothetical protein Hypma_002394 [Hypsizygus marmoreus]
MDPLPYPLFALVCISLCVSTLCLVFSTLVIAISPVLWIIPSAYIATVAYHATTLLISNSESHDSHRLFSLPNLLAAYALTCLWTVVFGVALAVSILIGGRIIGDVAPRGLWSLIVPCMCALAQAVVMGFIAFRTRKERNRILYAAKWKWRPGHSALALSQWSIGRPSPG